ncbi:MAG: PKD domain-containing protein [Gammaproteobacteria bacterium]|nr:PKD domain-containing protein [Gammaproteobacteria bacterium]
MRATWAALIYLSIFSAVFAATINDISITHCSNRTANCGKQLVGGARIDFDSIRWIGTEGAPTQAVLLRMDHPGIQAFGFTGQPNYQTENPVSNVWILETPSAGMLPGAQPQGSASVSHYFAPNKEGTLQSTAQYLAQVGSNVVPKNVNVQGEGVADSNEAITLAVEGVTDCITTDSICEKTISPGGNVTFTVSPQVDQTLVPAGVLPPEYVMAELIIQEVNTGCTSNNLTFNDRTNTANSFSPANYFHLLFGAGPTRTPPLCVRQISYLISPGGSFSFTAGNTRETGDGYVDYTFFIRGHYDPTDPEKWPDSHKTFRLRALSGAIPAARFTATPTFGKAPLAVKLNGSFSTPSSGASISSYQWQFKSTVTDESYTLAESDAIVETELLFGTYEITLTVTDDKGRKHSSEPQTVRVASEDDPVAVFELPASYILPLSEVPSLHVDGANSSPSSGANGITAYNWQIKEKASGSIISSPRLAAFDWPFDLAGGGDYEVSLSVTDDTGLDSLPETKTITVLTDPSMAVAAFSGAVKMPDGSGIPLDWTNAWTLLDKDSTVTISLDAADSRGSEGAAGIVSYRWASTDSADADPGLLTEVTYKEPGVYSITLTVVDDSENDLIGTASVSHTLTVLPPPGDLTADISMLIDEIESQSDHVALVEENIDVDGTDSAPQKEINAYNWLVLKDQLANYVTNIDEERYIQMNQRIWQPSPSFGISWDFNSIAGNATGDYFVWLTVTDGEEKASEAETLTISATKPPIAGFTYEPMEAAADDCAFLRAVKSSNYLLNAVPPVDPNDPRNNPNDPSYLKYSYDQDSGGITEYFWTIDAAVDSYELASNMGGFTRISFNKTGEYTVKLEITDDDGETGVYAEKLQVEEPWRTLGTTNVEYPADSPVLPVAARFCGGVLRENTAEVLADIPTVTTTENLTLKTIAEIDANHHDNIASVFVVAIYTDLFGGPVEYVSLNNNGTWGPWDINNGLASLPTYMETALFEVEHLHVDILQAKVLPEGLNSPGTYNIFTGYFLNDGLLVYGSGSINFRVTQGTGGPTSGGTPSNTDQIADAYAKFSMNPLQGSGNAPLKVFLDAGDSRPSEGGERIVSYQWTSSDGTAILPEPVTSITYEQKGIYSITLLIEDNLGHVGTRIQEVKVDPPIEKLAVDFSITMEKNGEVLPGNTIQWRNTIVDLDAAVTKPADMEIIGYQWLVLKDGFTQNSELFFNGNHLLVDDIWIRESSGLDNSSFDIKFESADEIGEYFLWLEVSAWNPVWNPDTREPERASVTKTIRIIGDAISPLAKFTYEHGGECPFIPVAGALLELNAGGSYDPDDDYGSDKTGISGYRWSVTPEPQADTEGVYDYKFLYPTDGALNVSTQENNLLQFHKAGGYTLTLMVTDSEGDMGTSSRTVRVVDHPWLPLGSEGIYPADRLKPETRFCGGVQLNETGEFLPSGSSLGLEAVTIKAAAEIGKIHRGKIADVLIVALSAVSPANPSGLLSLNNGSWNPWDEIGGIDALQPFAPEYADMTLPEILDISIYSAQILPEELRGLSSIFVAYRLKEDRTIVFNTVPISFIY